jgi:hypothetical protein
MQILKNFGIDWKERTFFSKLYTNQSVKLRLDEGERRSAKTGREVR